MNLVDIIILVIVAISMVFGLYRGFLSSLISLGGGLISFFLAFKAGPALAELLQARTSLVDTFSGYVDISTLTDADANLMQPVQSLVAQGTDAITNMFASIHLPEPIAALLQSDMIRSLVPGSENMTVQDYLSQALATVVVNALCYIICFLLIYLLVSLLFRLLEAVFRLPVLKQLNKAAGALFGILRGILIVFVLLSAVPLVESMADIGPVKTLISQSTLASWFTNGKIIDIILQGHL